MKDNLPIVVLAVAVLVVGVLQFAKDPVQVSVSSPTGEARVVELGAAPSPDVYQNTYFYAGLTYGGGCFSTTTTGTLTANMLEKNSCIYISADGAGQAALSLTLPASTTVSSLLPEGAGGCRDWFIDASDVAAGTTTTLVAGTGWDLVGLDATGAGTGADVIDGAEFGKLTACRQSDGDIVGYVQEYLAAD